MTEPKESQEGIDNQSSGEEAEEELDISEESSDDESDFYELLGIEGIMKNWEWWAEDIIIKALVSSEKETDVDILLQIYLAISEKNKK